MMRTRVKICGVTRPEDGQAAADNGADAIGLVFYPTSPRAVSVAQAQAIVRALPPLVSVVGLFLDAEADEVTQITRNVALDLLQFHGHESASFCEHFQCRYIKAIGMAGGDAWAVAQEHPHAAGLLLDGHAPGAAGGSGEHFDWDQALPVSHRIIVAGGLGAHNVAQAIEQTQPWGVDCSSSVESAPGIKDGRKIAAFSEEVYRVQRH